MDNVAYSEFTPFLSWGGMLLTMFALFMVVAAISEIIQRSDERRELQEHEKAHAVTGIPRRQSSKEIIPMFNKEDINSITDDSA